MQLDKDAVDIARRVIASTNYLTLATADGGGRPWASPVWYARLGSDRFVWVSKPEARHSRNLVDRSEVAIVIFDSTVAIGTGEAVYFEARAEELSGSELERGIQTFSDRSTEVGGRSWARADVVAPAALRLYCATASAAFALGEGDARVPVPLGEF